jgi:Putative Ig domain
VGSSYSFRPNASDADNDALRFSVVNKPAWAVFDASSGTLSGTPGAADAAVYSNIVISVSDGLASASLPAFSITVTEVSSGSVTLSWQPPTQNVDGTALTDLAGFRIYYGTSPTNLNQSVDIANPGLSRYVVENLSPATWYFAMKSYTAAATESDLSGVVSRLIQ